MTKQDFLRGWVLLIAQPWGARYANDTELANVQIELYYQAFQHLDPEQWVSCCLHAAAGNAWPSITTIRSWIGEGEMGADEAWAIVAPALEDDRRAICLTEEMQEGFRAAWALREDPIAARLAFRDAYVRALHRRCAAGQPAKWTVLTGTDHDSIQAARLEAAQKNHAAQQVAARSRPLVTTQGPLAIRRDPS